MPRAEADAVAEAFSRAAQEARSAVLIREPASVTLPGETTPSRFVCFYDPDGTVLELVENRSV
jgi:hypothetical protein